MLGIGDVNSPSIYYGEAAVMSLGGNQAANLWDRFANWLVMPSYNPIQAPPTVGVPNDLVTPPSSGDQASQTINDLLANQMSNWQSQSADIINSNPAVALSISDWLLIGVGALGFILIVGD